MKSYTNAVFPVIPRNFHRSSVAGTTQVFDPRHAVSAASSLYSTPGLVRLLQTSWTAEEAFPQRVKELCNDIEIDGATELPWADMPFICPQPKTVKDTKLG